MKKAEGGSGVRSNQASMRELAQRAGGFALR